ncbi:hypothetical protein bcgnr5371_37680 [Bacillus cereus]
MLQKGKKVWKYKNISNRDKKRKVEKSSFLFLFSISIIKTGWDILVNISIM